MSRPASVQAARRSLSISRSQAAIWFQLAGIRDANANPLIPQSLHTTPRPEFEPDHLRWVWDVVSL